MTRNYLETSYVKLRQHGTGAAIPQLIKNLAANFREWTRILSEISSGARDPYSLISSSTAGCTKTCKVQSRSILSRLKNLAADLRRHCWSKN